MTTHCPARRFGTVLAAGIILACAVGLAGCDGDAGSKSGSGAAVGQKPPSSAPPPIQRPGPLELADSTKRSGIEFVHTDGSSGRRFIMETVSCGLALFDYDGDGLTDIYFCNGAPLPHQDVDRPPRRACIAIWARGSFRTSASRPGSTAPPSVWVSRWPTTITTGIPTST